MRPIEGLGEAEAAGCAGLHDGAVMCTPIHVHHYIFFSKTHLCVHIPIDIDLYILYLRIMQEFECPKDCQIVVENHVAGTTLMAGTKYDLDGNVISQGRNRIRQRGYCIMCERDMYRTVMESQLNIEGVPWREQ